jgi:hypothetical protein
VFLHRFREELAFMREFELPTRVNSFVDNLFLLADQSAKFSKFGIVHFLDPLRANATTS